jgi:tripartite-type tricarboxylate transporter receptor subunit TctC
MSMTQQISLALVLAALAAAPAGAQTWPTRSVEMIIPFPAGSGVDLIGRSMAAALAEQFGQNVVVTNRDGAAGTLGFGQLAAAQPDGHTIGFGPTTPIANAPYLVRGVRYDVDSFAYVCQLFENVFTIAIGPHAKFTSARELFAAAQRDPGKVSYGHAGTGTIPHLSVANLADALKLQFNAVPFRGDAPLVPGLLRGEVDFAATAVSTIRGQQTIRPLAIFADERHPAYPDVPTVKELGVASSVPPGHNGLYAPKGLPTYVRTALENGCLAATKADVMRQAMTNTGQSIKYLSGADFHAQTTADYKSKGELIRRLGLANP